MGKLSLRSMLHQGVSGGNLLFCGAGLSADCLNFSGMPIGAASPLHHILNEALEYQYSDLQIAADEYIENFGEHGLMSLLEERYKISKITDDIKSILSYKWDRIYTTNYDDVISRALYMNSIDHYTANNTEYFHDIPNTHKDNLITIHLHGCLKKWDIHNFRKSCVLGRESYLHISANSKWSKNLREDYARANAVFFIGFSNSDFYLAEHLYSAAASKDKVFFINSESSASDRELIAKQKKFGEPHAIGKEAFADIVKQVQSAGGKPEIVLHSFKKSELTKASPERASVDEQEAFIVYGKRNIRLHFRDILDQSESYRANRTMITDVCNFASESGSISLILGGICSGKSIILDECIMNLITKGEIVFFLESKFHDLASEARSIIRAHPNCIIAIDNCFSLDDRLGDIVTLASENGTRLLLATRTIAYDSESNLRSRLSEDSNFRTFDAEVLDEAEGKSVISCADRIAVWGSQVSGYSQKIRTLELEHKSRLSGFLLGIFRSEHIRSRFIHEVDILRTSGRIIESALILALYLKSTGENVQENVLSELIGCDSVALFSSNPASKNFVEYSSDTGRFEVISSISAREALKNFFDSRVVTETIVDAVKKMEDVRYEIPFNKIYREFMRYTQLKQVVVNFDQQDMFFDRLSELWFCKRQVLFWLQWSMAMRDHKQWIKAERYLDEAYGRAQELDNFDTSHLDDQKAGLLFDSVPENASSSVFLKRFTEACKLLHKSIRSGEVTSHNYLTIQSLDNFMEKARDKILIEHKKIMRGHAVTLRNLVDSKYRAQGEGYIKNAMEGALQSLVKSIDFLNSE